MNSTPQNNLVENGFLAKTRAEERSAGPAERVFVAQAFTDVTEAVRGGLDKIADAVARKEESEKRIKQQIAACEKDRSGVRCNVASYFRGGMYVLIEELEIRDVRLVYVPARSVGNYGGEIDNWQWPRHTGDFAFYRAYVGRDGKPADHAADNVPYRPKHFLKVSDQGLRPSDFVQVIIEGPGHVPLNQVELNIKNQKEICKGAPFYVLGPLVADIAMGYDHIAAAIGGAIAAAAGADFLCYVTPAEHIRLPNIEDVKEGLIASKIAAHAADIAKGVPGAIEMDRKMAQYRKNLDWNGQISIKP